MRALITGSDGFIGKNLKIFLQEKNIEVKTFSRNNTLWDLKKLVREVDIVYHLAGQNRSEYQHDFQLNNDEFTRTLCEEIVNSSSPPKLVFSSSIHAGSNTPYGLSKLAAENSIKLAVKQHKISAVIYRLPSVFGKWAKPNYNSVVSTFCHNIANGIAIVIDDRDKLIKLVHIDDLISDFVSLIYDNGANQFDRVIEPCYQISVGELAKLIASFKESRNNLLVDKVGNGLIGKLYSTYLTYLSPSNFSYPLVLKEDSRGSFVEIIKTKDSGQVSYFTSHPGQIRGHHYHHQKSEKFLVVSGEAKFNFTNILSGEKFEITVSENMPNIVESIPGWQHSIQNIGSKKMISIVWASEVYDEQKPDTHALKID